MRFLPLFLCLSLSACAHMRPGDQIKYDSKGCQVYYQPYSPACPKGKERVEIICQNWWDGKSQFMGFDCMEDPKPLHKPQLDKIHAMDMMKPGVSF